MKVLAIIALLVGSALCSLEPAGYRSSPTYLPPSSRRGSSSLSSTYLPASRSSSHRQSTYSVPQNNYHQQQSSYQRGQNSYQASSYQPSQNYNSASSSTYLPPSNRQHSSSLPSNTYTPPRASSYQPSQDYNSASSSTYLPPSNRQHSSSLPSNTYIPPPPKDTYSLADVSDVRSSDLPSTSYGVPEYNGAHSRGYHRHNHQDDYNSEPAKYNFAYQVNDNYGNDFGHQESRNGAKTRGTYHVLLPDGRKQIVEYEADEAGYRPKISYENVQTDRAAYPVGGPY